MLSIPYKIVLGSKSPRRVELLKGLDIEFVSRVHEIDEIYPSSIKPKDVPEYLARKKAEAQKNRLGTDELLITADTIVIVDGEILEKPFNKEEAKSMIQKLVENTHTVVTGVSMLARNKWISFSDHTEVTFGSLTNEEIDYYIENYKPFDKAGSYGVQEWIGYVGIKKMNGSYYTVMGLPVHKVFDALKKF